MNYGMLISVMLLLVPTIALAAPPVWFGVESQKRSGDWLYINCSGNGLSLDLARAESLNSCRATAVGQIVNDIQVKTLSIETEQDASLHREITQNNHVKNLLCITDKEEIKTSDNGYEVYMRCKFDLSKVTISDAPEEEITNRPSSGSIIKNKAGIETIKSDATTTKSNYRKSSESRLTISSVPACTSILIRGRKSRSVTCNTNPQTVILFEGDTEAILRSNGFKPKTIKLNNTAGAADESITVIFD